MTHKSQSRWPAVRSDVRFSGRQVDDFEVRRERFCRDLGLLFDRLQSAFCHTGADERARCGQDQVAVEISLQIDIERREVLLDKIFKYCDLNFHIFTELLKILQRHFSDCHLIVPTLQGYELAREIHRFLGAPELECVYLKGDSDERLLMGEALQDASFEVIMEDTERHYRERGGVEKKRQEMGPGRELSMFRLGEDGEEEVLWMQVRVELIRKGEEMDGLRSVR
ncbi:MAG: hypothetical protein ACP5OU_10640 [Methanothrix sp.]